MPLGVEHANGPDRPIVQGIDSSTVFDLQVPGVAVLIGANDYGLVPRPV
jgi:hypothetical protein